MTCDRQYISILAVLENSEHKTRLQKNLSTDISPLLRETSPWVARIWKLRSRARGVFVAESTASVSNITRLSNEGPRSIGQWHIWHKQNYWSDWTPITLKNSTKWWRFLPKTIPVEDKFRGRGTWLAVVFLATSPLRRTRSFRWHRLSYEEASLGRIALLRAAESKKTEKCWHGVYCDHFMLVTKLAESRLSRNSKPQTLTNSTSRAVFRL